MKKYFKTTPEGTHDLLFKESMIQSNIERDILKVFAKKGFSRVFTPSIEYLDIFSLGDFAIPQEEIYKLTDNKGRLIAFRADSTLPIARLASTRLKDETLPIRLCYAQTVLKANEALKGNSDEILGAGVEIIGADGILCDLEVILTAFEALGACVDDFRVELSHAGIFDFAVEGLPIENEKKEEIRLSVGQKNYGLLNSLLEGVKKSPHTEFLRRLPEMFGKKEVLKEALELCPSEEIADRLNYLYKLCNILEYLGFRDKLIVDLGLVQKKEYYSDIVFKGYLPGAAQAVLTGGRYNNLLGTFSLPTPAIGFVINVTRLIEIRLTENCENPYKPAKVLVQADVGFEKQAVEYYDRLTEAVFSVLTSKEAAVSFAKEKGIREVHFVSREIQIIKIKEEKHNETFEDSPD